MGRKGPGKKLIMAESHSLRPNKDYMSQEALNWVNEQDNANEAICRAIEFYYRYFNDAEGIAKRQSKGFMKATRVEVDQAEEVVEVVDAMEVDNHVDAAALEVAKKMFGSVRRR